MDLIRRPLPLALVLGCAAFALFCVVATTIPAPDPWATPVFAEPRVSLWVHIALNNAVLITIVWGIWRYIDWRAPGRRAQWAFGVAGLALLVSWAIRAGVAEAMIGGQNVGIPVLIGALGPHAVIELALFAAPAAFAMCGRRPWGLRAHAVVIAALAALAVIEVWVSPITGVLGIT